MSIKSYIFIANVTAGLLAGCSLAPTNPEPAPSANGKHQHTQSNPACAEPAQASIRCSSTVTASFDSQGQLWVAWVAGLHIYVQSSADKGQHFSQAVKVNAEPETITAHDEYRPKLKLDKHGNIYLTWTQNLGSMRSGHIRFSRSTDGGKSFSTPITLSDNLANNGHRFDVLALGQNGEVFAAWLDARDKEQAKATGQEFSGSSLYYTWSADGGQNFAANKIIAPHSCECCRLEVVVDADNLPSILWRQVFEGGIRDHALIKFKDWNTPGEMHRVGIDNWKIDACPHHGPALTLDNSGRYHAVWFSGAADNTGLFYAHSTDHGQTFSEPYRFTATGKHAHVLAVADQLAIVWLEFDGKRTSVQSIRSKDSGASWSQPRQLGAVEGNADYAFLVGDGRQIYLSWQTAAGYQFSALTD